MWKKVCSLDELREGEPLGVEIDAKRIGLFLVNGQCHAIGDICPHEYALLSDGYQEQGVVECPLHQARFEIATGKCLGLPAERDVPVFEVSVEGGDVLVKFG